MRASADRQDDPVEAVRSIRAIRRRELFRIAVGELFGETDVASVGAALSRLTDATLAATLVVAGRSVRTARGLDEAPTRMAIVAMGRYGGFELSYGSDADVLFVHDPLDGADGEEATAYAHAVGNELRQLLLGPGTDPALVVDADLRPEGKQGPLVRTLASYAIYYGKWSKVWEAQALLRADAVVGDESVRAALTALVDPLRYPPDGISTADVSEIQRIKARVDRERLPRGADRLTHLKLGRGGLADIEWTVQLIQLRHAGRVPGLRSPRTLTALDAARDADLITAADHSALDRAWRSVSRLRNAITLVTGRTGDQVPRDARERAAIASILGYGAGRSDEMVNDYLRTTRRARAVVDRVFWGE
jgi:glutamate-ammonia-ligase adenylyltransferase